MLRVPLFPLPDVVFFPETVLPLHVFEARYRRMVADCLDGDRRLAVVRLRPGWEKDYEGRPPIHEVACVGEILQAELLPDGRSNILLDGRLRIRIEAEEASGDRPYRVAQARPLRDRGVRAADPGLSDALLALRAVHAKLLGALGQAHPEMVGRLTAAGMSAGAVVDRIVSAVVPDAAVRQRVLETLDVPERLELASAALAELLAFVTGSQEESDRGED